MCTFRQVPNCYIYSSLGAGRIAYPSRCSCLIYLRHSCTMTGFLSTLHHESNFCLGLCDPICKTCSCSSGQTHPKAGLSPPTNLKCCLRAKNRSQSSWWALGPPIVLVADFGALSSFKPLVLTHCEHALQAATDLSMHSVGTPGFQMASSWQAALDGDHGWNINCLNCNKRHCSDICSRLCSSAVQCLSQTNTDPFVGNIPGAR